MSTQIPDDFGSKTLPGGPLSCGLLSDTNLAVIDHQQQRYRPMDIALEALRSGDDVEVTVSDDAIVFVPRKVKSGSGVVFFPGLHVEPAAYAPFLRALAQKGHTVAVFDLKLSCCGQRDAFVSQHADVGRWFFGGHSLGGTVATEQARFSRHKVEGVFLFAAYPVYNDRGTRFLDIRAENDQIQSLPPFRVLRSFFAPLTRFYVPKPNITRVLIAGGNHANFGYYGPQKHDGIASISRELQQEIVFSKVLEFMDGGVTG